ncbi:SUKH-4 family immunity protein [Streptomyces phaeochromogenes]
MSEHREAAARALSAPLDLLVVAVDQYPVGVEGVNKWILPESDRMALIRWGLPMMEDFRLVVNLQEGVSPELDVRGRKFYSLGLFAEHEVGSCVGSGEVWGFNPDENLPDSFVNSSVAYFVETAWRWYWVYKEVRPLRFDIEQYDLLDDFIDFSVRLDPQVGSAVSSMWRGIIESW